MGAYQIITDSTADLTPELVRELDVQVIPLCYMMEGRTYHNIPGGGELTEGEFYAKLRAGTMSTTTQINSEEFLRVFTPLLEAGQDVLYIAFSSGLSGTAKALSLPGRSCAAAFRKEGWRCSTLSAPLWERACLCTMPPSCGRRAGTWIRSWLG